MKNTREQLDIINAYNELGSYRAAAALCMTTDETVKQIVGAPAGRRTSVPDTCATGAQHSQGHGPHPPATGCDGRTDQGQETPSGGGGSGLRRLGVQLPPGSGEGQEGLEGAPAGVPPMGAEPG